LEKKKVTIYDVSQRLGVSTATVNRALNGKPKVSEEMRKRVIETADEMGYKASKTASSLSRKEIKIGVVLNDTIAGFIKDIKSGAKKALEDLADYKVSGEIRVTKTPDDKKEFEELLWEMVDKGCNGIAVVPPSIEAELDDVIQKIRARGIIVGTAVSDMPTSKRNLSVRNNGIVAGQMAAQILHWLVGREPVAIVTGYRDSTVHKETITGFRKYADLLSMNEAGIYEHRDDPEIAYYLATRMIRERPDIKGIYFGSANSVTFCNRLEELGYAGKIKIVASDLLPGIVEHMKKGTVDATIFQNPFDQGRLVVTYIYRMLAENFQLENDVKYLNPRIVLTSNLELHVPE
jgi:LacI family transcriptional regulator